LSSILIRIDGQPIGKGRPRFGNGRTYTPKRTRDYEARIAQAAQQEVRDSGWICSEAPVEMEVLAQFEIPKSWTKLKQRTAEQGNIMPARPDIDNVAKAALDALNGIVYADDSQVCKLDVRKRYGLPMLVILVRIA